MSVRVVQTEDGFQHVDVCLTFFRNCSLKPALRFFPLRETVGAAAVAAVATGSDAEKDVGFVASAIDVATVADANDGSFVVLVDVIPDLLGDSLLFVGLADPLLLDSEFGLSAS